jgi:outer membrane protein assembly factor BamB
MGPDIDIGNSPILKSLPDGKRALIVGTKQGHVIALDPDNKGAVLYRVLATTVQPVTMGGGRGGNIVWGGAADDQNVYHGARAGTGLVALRLGTGDKAWAFTPPQGDRLERRLLSFPALSLKEHPMDACSQFRPRTENQSGISTLRRNSRR